jgi:hypothetical protein
MTTRISGTRDGHKWPDQGETIDLPDEEAVTLVDLGLAIVAPAAKPAEVAAATPEGETATATPAKAQRTRKAAK